MQTTIRKAADRGRTRLDWLDGAHSFSFGSYRDPAWMGFRGLRVINEDHIAPGGGFGAHPHAEMEILTWVIDGALLHRDSTGNSGVIRAGEAQRMSAGTGIVHSEMNASDHEPVHLRQIWLPPNRDGLAPGYEQRAFPSAGSGLQRVADPGARDGALRLHADASISVARLAAGERLVVPVATGRHGWLQLVAGSVRVGDTALEAGDGLAVSDTERVEIEASEDAHGLWFELA
jgi:redox-sensitive bicupin YhaK (pirin superfamily)